VADRFSGLQVVDISVPESPVIVGAVVTPGGAGDLVVAGNYAYVADSISGLQVIDISMPGSPAIVGAVSTPDVAKAVVVAGNYAYVADRASGLQVIDISVPESPAVVGAVDTPGSAEDVAVAGNYAYVTDGVSGLQVIDISVPESPTLKGAVDTPDFANGVVVVGSYVYVADGLSGLKIAWQQCGATTAVEDGPAVVPSAGIRLGAYPNPFNPQTTITFSLERAGRANVEVYEVSGKRVAILADQTFAAGEHSFLWNGRDLAGRSMSSGTYLVRLKTASAVTAQKLMLVR
jgi:uncharacterized secreted protein with C-terminal beta-propeller domain